MLGQKERASVQLLDVRATDGFGYTQDHQQDATRDVGSPGSTFRNVGERKQQRGHVRYPLSFIASPVAAHVCLRCDKALSGRFLCVGQSFAFFLHRRFVGGARAWFRSSRPRANEVGIATLLRTRSVDPRHKAWNDGADECAIFARNLSYSLKTVLRARKQLWAYVVCVAGAVGTARPFRHGYLGLRLRCTPAPPEYDEEGVAW